MKKLLAAGTLLLSVGASAQGISSQSSGSALKTAWIDYEDAGIEAPQPPAAAEAVAAQTGGEMGLMAQPMGSSMLAHVEDRDGANRSARLIINNSGDRVGAEVLSCVDAGSPDNAQACDSLRFLFPQLQVNREAKEILLNGEVVAKYGGFMGMRMVNGFKLKLDYKVQEMDKGFNRELVDVYTVTLVRSSK